MKIAIVTDSTCDLAPDYLAKNDIYVLPLKIIYKGKECYDRVDIQPEEVYRSLQEEIPGTSMPGPGEVKELFAELQAKGYDHIIALHISSGLSSTLNVVKMVAEQFPQLKVEVVDSKALSMGLGFLVMKAVQLRELGAKFSDVVKQVREAQQKIKIFFVVKTLEYLKKGGRIGLVQASLGEILDIKPIISINEEGKYFTFAKARGRSRSIAKLKEIFAEYARGKQIDLAVMHGDAEAECLDLLHDLLQTAGVTIRKQFFGQIGPAMGVHSGPGLLGFAIYENV